MPETLAACSRPRFVECLSLLLLSAAAFQATVSAEETQKIAVSATREISGAAEASAGKPHVIPDLKMELVWVKAGDFTMGTPADEPGRNKAEGPQRRVTLTHGFWLGKTEVTQGQYEALTGANPSHFKNVGPDGPVEEVSWIDAMAFCRKLTERERGAGRLPEGYVFTLPTEAQWEYACRAGTSGAYAGNPEAMAWHKNNSGDTTHPVATKQPNAWGLYDMYGNVLEWCLDWFGDYPRGAATDPRGPESGYFRMARGGSWRVELFRSGSRGGGSAGRRDYTLGFRLALCRER
jgi:formylglycine-generating enzyme required for sulfatase activity